MGAAVRVSGTNWEVKKRRLGFTMMLTTGQCVIIKTV